MNYNLKLVVKLTISAVIFIGVASIMKYYQPTIGGSIAVGQLEDSHSSGAGVKMWQDFKSNWIIGYGLFVLILFFNDLIRLFRKKY